MTSEQFVYWLQGYLELSGAKEFNEQQVQAIKDHIQLVMKKVTPNINPYPNVMYTPTTSDKIDLYPNGPMGTPKNPYKFETFCTLVNTTDETLSDIKTHLTC